MRRIEGRTGADDHVAPARGEMRSHFVVALTCR